MRRGRTQGDFRNLSPRSHVYQIPDTYVGFIQPDLRSELVFHDDTETIVPKTLTTSHALARIVLEIIANAGDNVCITRDNGRFEVGNITLNISTGRSSIEVINQGEPIPIEPHLETTKARGEIVMVPDFIFGEMRTSSNYDDRSEYTGCGRNGYGAKLTNIFSRKFSVEAGDPIRKQYHSSEWKGPKMAELKSVTIPGYELKPAGRGIPLKVQALKPTKERPAYDGPPFVSIKFEIDFERFEMPDGFSEDDVALFKRFAIDFSLTCRVPVTINDKTFNFSDIRKYASLMFTADQCASARVVRFWKKPDATRTHEYVTKSPRDNDDIPWFEAMVLDTPGNSRIVSFVNGLMTPRGGTHVTHIQERVTTMIIGKMKKRTDDENGPKITPSDVKPHFSLIIVARVPDTAYDSQMKMELVKPKKISIPMIDDFFKGVEKSWTLFDHLDDIIRGKELLALAKKTDGKKKRDVALAKGENANLAGSSRSSECSLFITEGNSAAGYVQQRIKHLGGKDLYGYLPLQGKFMNVDNATPLQLSEYAEYIQLKAALGLKEEYDYMTEEQLDDLNYGAIIVATDADDDGKHIMGLLIHLFMKKWPGILKAGRFMYLLTPAVRVIDARGHVLERFFSEEEYIAWQEKQTPGGPRKRALYFKGLGSSEEEHVVEDLKEFAQGVVTCDVDDGAPANVNLLFGKKMASQRKKWMLEGPPAHVPATVLDETFPEGDIRSREISDFIDVDMRGYCRASMFRAIPSMHDTLKKSIRQILFWFLTKWKYGTSPGINDKANAIKLSTIAGSITSDLQYHHGEASLIEAITGAGQGFVGSNNLPIINGIGNFGTRNKCGKDAAAGRYIRALPSSWMKYVFSESLISVIPRRVVEGKEVEPTWIPMDIPIGIINGWSGIATGWSSVIPAHNPLEIIDWLFMKMDGGEKIIEAPLPWYRGFKGDTAIVTTRSQEDIAADTALMGDGDDEEEGETSSSKGNKTPSGASADGRRFVTSGRFKIIRTLSDSWDVEITELPIGKGNFKYRKWLESLRSEKKLKRFDDKGDTDVTHYIIKGLKFQPTLKSLRLTSSIPLTNIVVIDDQGNPKRCPSVTGLLETFFESVSGAYEMKKRAEITQLEAMVAALKNKILFLTLVVDKVVNIIERPENDINADLKRYGVDVSQDPLKKTPMSSLTKEGLEASRKKLEDAERKLDILKKTPSIEMWRDRLKSLRAHLTGHHHEEKEEA